MRFEDFNRLHPMDSKILIVPHRNVGYQMVWKYVSKYHEGCRHLKIYTLSQLAEEISAEHRLVHDIRLIDSKEGSRILFRLLHKQIDRLPYFCKEQCTLELARELGQTFQEIKLQDLSFSAFKGKSVKLETLFTLLTLYNAELETHKLWDQADLYRNIDPNAYPKKHSHTYAIVSNYELSPLEEQFFLGLTDRNYQVIPMPTPAGHLSVPASYYPPFQTEERYTHHPLLDLYSDNQASGNRIHLFKAYGESNEVQYVFQYLMKRNIPWDQAIILYTDPHYANLIHWAAEYDQVPLTLGSGLKLTSTRSFHFIRELCRYIVNGFQIEDLKGLFLEGCIDFETTEGDNLSNAQMSSPAMYEMMLTLKIGWGLERTIEKLSTTVQERDASQDPNVERRRQACNQLIGWFEAIRTFAAQDMSAAEPVDWHSLVKGLLSMAKAYIRVKGYRVKNESIAKNAILSELEQLLQGPNMMLSLEEAASQIVKQLEQASILSSSDAAGALHADMFDRTGVLHRPYVFVIGLDSKRFPVRRNDSPILTDAEREMWSHRLKKARDSEDDSKYKLLETLGTADGEILLGYSYFDTQKVRERNPSTFVQQVLHHFGKTEKEIADFGFVPQEAEMIRDQLGMVLYGWSTAEYGQAVYPFKETSAVHHAPESEALPVLSPSAIERMAACHRKYYLHDVLKLRTVDEPGYDPGVWLQKNEYGTLLHAIFERYIREIVINKETSDIQRIVLQEFDKAKAQIPCPTEELYENELQRAREVCERFVDSLEQDMQREGWTPIAVETEFDAVEIRLPGDVTFALQGKIDRIDLLSDGTYRIVDYKTGKKKSFEENQAKHLQHYLYKLALEATGIDGKEIAVSEAVYQFPFDEDQVIFRNSEMEETYGKDETILNQDIVRELILKMQEGSIEPASDPKACSYCDYKEVCRVQIEVND